MIIFMPVSLFEHKPKHCPFGHPLWPGQARVGWKPCICAAAQEGAERGRGMGHLLVSCQTCQPSSGTRHSTSHRTTSGATRPVPGSANPVSYWRRAGCSGGRVVISTVPLYAMPRTWITGASVGSR